jgi:hypothetical protein
MSTPRHIRLILPSKPGPGTVDWNEIMLQVQATYGDDVIIDDIGWEIIDLTEDTIDTIAEDLFSTDDSATDEDTETQEDEENYDDEDDDNIELIHYIDPDEEDPQ